MIELDELVTGLLPRNQVSILAGASGAGKSTLALQAVRDMLLGQSVMGVFGLQGPPPGRVGYVVADRTAKDLMMTAQALDVPMRQVFLRSLVDDPSIDIGKFEVQPLAILFELLASMPVDIRFVVVDPLIVFTGVDTNKYHLNAAKLIRINRFAMDHQLTVLGTHHATKARKDITFKREQDRISGSSALLGYTSTQLFLSTPEENDTEFFQWTVVSHHAAPRTILLSRGDRGFVLEDDDTPSVPLESRIMGVLAVGPCKVQDLMASLGASKSTLHRFLHEMQQTGVVVRGEWGVYRLARKADHKES